MTSSTMVWQYSTTSALDGQRAYGYRSPNAFTTVRSGCLSPNRLEWVSTVQAYTGSPTARRASRATSNDDVTEDVTEDAGADEPSDDSDDAADTPPIQDGAAGRNRLPCHTSSRTGR